VLTSIAIVAGVAGVAIAGAQVVADRRGPVIDQTPVPAPSINPNSQPFPGIWPEATEFAYLRADVVARAEEARAQAEGKSDFPDSWRLDPVGVARQFALVVLGWEPQQVEIQTQECDGTYCAVGVRAINHALTDEKGEHPTVDIAVFQPSGGHLLSVSSVSSSSFVVHCPYVKTRILRIGSSQLVCGELYWHSAQASVSVALLGEPKPPVDFVPTESSPRAVAKIQGIQEGSYLFRAALGPIPDFEGARSATLVIRLKVGDETVGLYARPFGLGNPGPTPGPTTSPETPLTQLPLPAVWPETNMRDIWAAQGNPRAWRLDASETARRFAIDVLKWRDANISRIGGEEAKGSVVVEAVLGPYGANVDHGPDANRVDMRLAQLATRGQGGVWSVIDVWSPHLQLQAGGVDMYSANCPDVKREIRRGIGAMMCARVSGVTPDTRVKSVTFAIFEGARVSISDLSSASGATGSLIPPRAHDFFYGGLTECVCDEASILFVEAIDRNGTVIAAATERIGNTGRRRSSPVPPRHADTSVGLWPLQTKADVRSALRDIRPGHDRWMTDPRLVGLRFAQEVLGWPRSSIGIDGDAMRPGWEVEAVWNRDVNRSEGLSPDSRSTATVMFVTERARCEGHITDWYFCYTAGTIDGPHVWTAYGFRTQLLQLSQPGDRGRITVPVGQVIPIRGRVRHVQRGATIDTVLEPMTVFGRSTTDAGNAGLAGYPTASAPILARGFHLSVRADRFVARDAVLVIRVVDATGRTLGMETREYRVG
jgi:hypothetical protein